MITRPATMMDFEEIHDIFLEVHDLHLKGTEDTFKDEDPFTREEFQGILDDQNSIFLVAEEIKIVGFLNATIKEREGRLTNSQKIMHIEQLGVKKEEHKRGIGKALMLEIKKIALKKKCDNIMLDVWSFNENAKEFYEHLGFKSRKIQMKLNL